MTGDKDSLSSFSESSTSGQIVLGNDANFSVKGTRSISFILDLGEMVHMDGIFYVLGLKRNLISVSALEDKGFKVCFSKGKVLVWKSGYIMRSATVIGN